MGRKKFDHVFKPGDPAFGWGRQCSVIVPVKEDGFWVSAHCGAPEDEHQDVEDPQHHDSCAVRWEDAECDCRKDPKP